MDFSGGEGEDRGGIVVTTESEVDKDEGGSVVRHASIEGKFGSSAALVWLVVNGFVLPEQMEVEAGPSEAGPSEAGTTDGQSVVSIDLVATVDRFAHSDDVNV